jgi:hypothetical protein
MVSKKLVLFGLLILVFTVFLSIKTVDNFQATNCAQITDCKTCGNTYGCSYCKVAKKCVNKPSFNTSCPNDTEINTAEDCITCSSYTNCKTCSSEDPCTWCKTSNKCVNSSSANSLCPRESKAVDPRACEDTNIASNRGIEYVNGVPYGVTYDGSRNKIRDQNPYQFDVVSSRSAIQTQLNMGAYSSNPYSSDGVVTNPVGPSVNNPSSNTFDYSDISLSYPGNSVIPILGLQRDNTNHLTKESLRTVLSAARVSGLVTTGGSKQALLDAIRNESNFYIEQKKNYIKRFVDNSIDYINDEEALFKIRDIDIKIMDLNDISGYVKGVEGFKSKFKEGYQNLHKKDIFEYELEKNKSAAKYIQYLWCINLIGIGTFLYFINNS